MPKKRKDGRLQASFRDENGTRHYVYGYSRSDLAANLAAKRTEVARGEAKNTVKQTMSAYLATWLDRSVKPPHRAAYTYANYQWAVNSHIIPHIGDIILGKLRPTDIKDLYTALAGKLSPQSVRHIHRVLNSALEEAVSLEILDRNPAKKVELPRVERREKPALSKAEIRALLDATRDDRLHALWVLLAGTGIRISEATGLSWHQLELDREPVPVLHVRDSLHYLPDQGYWLGQPKSGRSRTVELSRRIVAALRKRRVQQAEERLAAGPDWNDNDLVFCTPYGAPLYRSYPVYALTRICARAGVRRVTPHAFRHAVISHLLADGMYLWDVSEMAGHANTSTTTNIYMRSIGGSRGSAAQRVDALLGDEEDQ